MSVSDAAQPGKGEHIRNEEVDETVLEKEGHELEAAVLDAEEELAQADRLMLARPEDTWPMIWSKVNSDWQFTSLPYGNHAGLD